MGRLIRRYLARAALLAIAAGALFGLWLLRISTRRSIWPAVGHHPRVLVFIFATVLWVGGVVAVLFVAAFAISKLWKEAKR